MRGIVILVRGWRLFIGILILMALGALDRFVSAALGWPTELAMEPIGSPHFEDFAESEVMGVIFARPAPEQAPPPASMPIGNRYVHTERQNYYSRFTPIDDTGCWAVRECCSTR